jgi:hypothetical protein
MHDSEQPHALQTDPEARTSCYGSSVHPCYLAPVPLAELVALQTPPSPVRGVISKQQAVPPPVFRQQSWCWRQHTVLGVAPAPWVGMVQLAQTHAKTSMLAAPTLHSRVKAVDVLCASSKTNGRAISSCTRHIHGDTTAEAYRCMQHATCLVGSPGINVKHTHAAYNNVSQALSMAAPVGVPPAHHSWRPCHTRIPIMCPGTSAACPMVESAFLLKKKGATG